MPKYKEGDKVKVLDDLEVRSGYYMDDGSHHNSVVPEMTHLRGQVVTIEEVDCYGYHIREDGGGWGWTDEMFAGFAVKYHVGDKVMVRSDLDDLHAPAMRELAGHEVTITGEDVVDVFGSEPGYSIAEDDGMWVWHAAKVLFAMYNGHPINPYDYTDFESLLNILTRGVSLNGRLARHSA